MREDEDTPTSLMPQMLYDTAYQLGRLAASTLGSIPLYGSKLDVRAAQLQGEAYHAMGKCCFHSGTDFSEGEDSDLHQAIAAHMIQAVEHLKRVPNPSHTTMLLKIEAQTHIGMAYIAMDEIEGAKLWLDAVREGADQYATQLNEAKPRLIFGRKRQRQECEEAQDMLSSLEQSLDMLADMTVSNSSALRECGEEGEAETEEQEEGEAEAEAEEEEEEAPAGPDAKRSQN
ncbi:hypothetical protein KIPB_005916 [Kipferlia bialata]|uniref:Uncharacterized protein n=2 Tax=Kipferlia bialata TaxID=797122 RepID=A0A9K3CW68_9EUKA|nr:hypothetical protein KIPB_004278 [Kipferlia bialata]GIQ84429.1 hypothetical protein KIPB_005916 [Kipferlia bialata]|eukprot:g4278.t1